MEFVIYTDESDKDGEYFSIFYRRVHVRSEDLALVLKRLAEAKDGQNFYDKKRSPKKSFRAHSWTRSPDLHKLQHRRVDWYTG